MGCNRANGEGDQVKDERQGKPSASGGSKWYSCPGSVALEAIAPEEEPTDEAIQGSEIAKAREEESEDGLDEEGKTIAQRLTEQESQALADWLSERFPGAVDGNPLVFREERLWARDDAMKPMVSAKPDWFYIFKDEALCGDDKSGYLAVTEAHKNIQARIQALCLKHEYPHLKRIRVAISQFRFKKRFTACDYDEQGLAIAEKEVFFRLWLTTDPYAVRTAGDHCRWCKAKASCPESAAYTMLPMVPFQGRDIAKKDIPAAVATLDLQTLGFLRHKSALISNILDAVGARLKKEFTPEQLATVGLQLVPSAGVRTLPNVEQLWAVLHGQGVTDVEFRAILRSAYGAAQELLIAKIQKDNPELTQKAAKEQADKILEPAVKMAARDPQLRSL